MPDARGFEFDPAPDSTGFAFDDSAGSDSGFSFPADRTQAGVQRARNQNPAWARSVSQGVPRAMVEAIEPVAANLGANAAGAWALASGLSHPQDLPRSIPVARAGGAYFGGALGRFVSEPFRTLTGMPSSEPIWSPETGTPLGHWSLESLRRAHEAGLNQMLFTGAGDALTKGGYKLGTTIGRRALNPGRKIKIESAPTVEEQDLLADKVLAREFPGGVKDSYTASRLARGAAVRRVSGLLKRAERQSTQGRPPRWSTVGSTPPGSPPWAPTQGQFGSPVQQRGFSRTLGQMQGLNPVSNAPISPGRPIGYAYDPQELFPAVRRVVKELRAANAPQEKYDAVYRHWQVFLRDAEQNFGQLTPGELRTLVRKRFGSGRSVLASEKNFGDVDAGKHAGAMLDVEIARQGNRMLRRIPGFRPAQREAQDLVNTTKALRDAVLRPKGPLPWRGDLTAPLTHVGRSYRTAKALRGAGIGEALRQFPRFAGYAASNIMTDNRDRSPVDDLLGDPGTTSPAESDSLYRYLTEK